MFCGYCLHIQQIHKKTPFKDGVAAAERRGCAAAASAHTATAAATVDGWVVPSNLQFIGEIDIDSQTFCLAGRQSNILFGALLFELPR